MYHRDIYLEWDQERANNHRRNGAKLMLGVS